MKLSQQIAAKQQERPRGRVEVEEWGGEDEPCILYFSQLTARDITHISRKHPNMLKDVQPDAMVEMIVHKSEDEAGEKVFGIDDKPILMRESLSVLSKVFAAIFEVGSEADTEKN
jgi:hypothetical protein